MATTINHSTPKFVSNKEEKSESLFSRTFDSHYHTHAHTHAHTHTHTHLGPYMDTYIPMSTHISTMIYIYIYISPCGVMVIVIGNGHGDPSSDPGQSGLYFT